MITGEKWRGGSERNRMFVGVFLSSFLTFSCQNMLTGNDVTDKVSADVAAANAESVSIRIQPDPSFSSAGIPSPLGNTTAKVGIAFPISTTVDNAYVFRNWTQVGGNGEVAFAAPFSSGTNATVTKAASDLVIQANYTARPIVSSTDPFVNATNVGTNKVIKIIFSKSLDPKTLSIGNVTVTTIFQGKIGQVAATDITSQFSLAPVTLVGSTAPIGFTLTASGGLSIVQMVQVTLHKAISDSDGNPMQNDYSFQFYTGSAAVSLPTVISLAIAKDSLGTSLLGSDGGYNAYPIYVKPTCNVDISSGQTILSLRVILTDVDASGNQLAGTTPETKEMPFSSGWNAFTPAASHPEGRKRVEVQVKDNYNADFSALDPAHDSGTIVYDLSPPGNATATATAQAGAKVLLSWTEPMDADYKQVNISWTDGTNSGSTIVPKGTTSYTTEALTENPYTFTFKTQDNLGNVQSTGVTASATADATPPASVSGQAAVANAGGTVSLHWTEPTTTDYAQVNISWTDGTHSGGYSALKGTTSYTTGVLANGAYTFTFKTQDSVGNIETTGVTASATADGTPPDNVGVESATANSDGTFTLGWTNPANLDFAATVVSWSGGSLRVSGTPSQVVTNVKTPVLGQAKYDFTFKAEDATGNAASGTTKNNVSTNLASLAIVLDTTTNPPTLSYSSATSTLTLTYAVTSGTAASLRYWTGDTSTPSSSTPVTTGFASPFSITGWSAPQANDAFGFCLVDSGGSTSISYTFTWTTDYGSATAKSLVSSGRWVATSASTGVAKMAASKVSGGISNSSLAVRARSYSLIIANYAATGSYNAGADTNPMTAPLSAGGRLDSVRAVPASLAPISLAPMPFAKGVTAIKGADKYQRTIAVDRTIGAQSSPAAIFVRYGDPATIAKSDSTSRESASRQSASRVMMPGGRTIPDSRMAAALAVSYHPEVPTRPWSESSLRNYANYGGDARPPVKGNDGSKPGPVLTKVDFYLRQDEGREESGDSPIEDGTRD